MIVKTSNLGYDVSYYEVDTSLTVEQLEDINYNSEIPIYRHNSTTITQLKDACEKMGYKFEYTPIIEKVTIIPSNLKNLKVDYIAHFGNY